MSGATIDVERLAAASRRRAARDRVFTHIALVLGIIVFALPI